MLALTIALCIIGPMLWALYVQRNARRRLALAPEHPDKPYETSGPYVIGGRWGYSLVTGDLRYETYKFTDDQTAAYMCTWLNNGNDHRSLAMVFFDCAAKMEVERAKREAQREADLAIERAKLDSVSRYDPCYCTTCDRYIDRATARTRSFLRTGRCTDCEITHHERRLVASYQVPGVMLGDGPWPWQTESPRASKFTRSSGPL